MKLKLLITGLILTGIIFSTGISYAASKKSAVPSSFVYQAISKYKNKNYTGCIQDMDYVIGKRPTDVAYYYKALSYAQLGMQNEAKTAYLEAIKISSNRSLVDYATQAVNCINDSTLCDSNANDNDIAKFIKSNEFMHQDVKDQLQNKTIDKAKIEINSDVMPTKQDLKYLNQNNTPSDKEIADAVRTLSKLGINPFNTVGNNLSMWGQNPEIAQINAMFGNQNNNNNNMMNLIPMMSAMQSSPNGNNTVNKDFIQTFMMSQMLPNFNFSNSDK